MAFGKIEPRHAGSGRKHRELRTSMRQSIGEAGWVRPDGGFARWPCMVLDISDTGVRLKVDPNQTVPTIFSFVLAKAGGLGRRARVQWRRDSEIGAEFL